MTETVARQPSWPQTALAGRASVLVIDGDAGRRRFIGRILRAAGCTVTSFAEPTAARSVLSENRCDVLLLSLESRQEDWMAAVRACCPEGSVPVLALLEDDSSEAVARMLDMGADDCLTAPFDASDLSVRIVRLMRLAWRRRGMAPPDWVTGLQLDFTRPLARLGGREIPLTKLEYRTLWVLAQGKGGVSPFNDIELRVWGDTGRSHRWVLRRVIRNLRRKLGCGASGHVLLLAEPRIGYRLVGSVSPP
jgi:DNA-binding response OmpR family regulator